MKNKKKVASLLYKKIISTYFIFMQYFILFLAKMQPIYMVYVFWC
jgi:hypothetical protein